jgi:hypothetical protein
VPTTNFFGKTISGIGATVINYKVNENGNIYNYILFGFISDNYFYLNKMYFTSTDIILNNPIKVDESFSQHYIKGNTVSCFITDSKIIICLTLF